MSLDPLKRTSQHTITLFEKFGRELDGFQFDQVADAAFNLIINALRQAHPKRETAEREWDELVSKAKAHLMDCYDSTGRLKGVYPYHQVINVPYMDLRDK